MPSPSEVFASGQHLERKRYTGVSIEGDCVAPADLVSRYFLPEGYFCAGVMVK